MCSPRSALRAVPRTPSSVNGNRGIAALGGCRAAHPISVFGGGTQHVRSRPGQTFRHTTLASSSRSKPFTIEILSIPTPARWAKRRLSAIIVRPARRRPDPARTRDFVSSTFLLPPPDRSGRKWIAGKRIAPIPIWAGLHAGRGFLVVIVQASAWFGSGVVVFPSSTHPFDERCHGCAADALVITEA